MLWEQWNSLVVKFIASRWGGHHLDGTPQRPDPVEARTCSVEAGPLKAAAPKGYRWGHESGERFFALCLWVHQGSPGDSA